MTPRRPGSAQRTREAWEKVRETVLAAMTAEVDAVCSVDSLQHLDERNRVFQKSLSAIRAYGRACATQARDGRRR